MNELRAPYGRPEPTNRDADQPGTGGFRITKCGVEDCSWQSVEADDSVAYNHMIKVHPDVLERAWWFGRM